MSKLPWYAPRQINQHGPWPDRLVWPDCCDCPRCPDPEPCELAAAWMEPIEAEEARVVAESFLASPQIDTVTIVRRWRNGSIIPELCLVLAIVGVAGAVFAPVGYESATSSSSVAVASILAVFGVIVSGCIVSSDAKRRPWLTRVVVVVWGLGAYSGSIALFFALPHSVASGLLNLIGM